MSCVFCKKDYFFLLPLRCSPLPPPPPPPPQSSNSRSKQWVAQLWKYRLENNGLESQMHFAHIWNIVYTILSTPTILMYASKTSIIALPRCINGTKNTSFLGQILFVRDKFPTKWKLVNYLFHRIKVPIW